MLHCFGIVFYSGPYPGVFLGVCNPSEYPGNASLFISQGACPPDPQLPDGRPVTPHLSWSGYGPVIHSKLKWLTQSPA